MGLTTVFIPEPFDVLSFGHNHALQLAHDVFLDTIIVGHVDLWTQPKLDAGIPIFT